MRTATLTILAICATASSSSAESVPYRMPPRAIADIADALPTPQVVLDPTGTWLLVLEHEALASMADLSKEELRLAGIRLNPATNARSRRDVAVRAELLRVADGSTRSLQGLPPAPRIDDVSFSPDGALFAFTHTTEDGLELWVGDVGTATAKRVLSGLNGVFDDIYHWRPDSRGLLARTVPRNRGAAPAAPSVPEGPVVQETSGETAAAWTYPGSPRESSRRGTCSSTTGRRRSSEVDLDGKTTVVGAPALASRSGAFAGREAPSGRAPRTAVLLSRSLLAVRKQRRDLGAVGEARAGSSARSPRRERSPRAQRRPSGSPRDPVEAGRGRHPLLGRSPGRRRPEGDASVPGQAVLVRRPLRLRAARARLSRPPVRRGVLGRPAALAVVREWWWADPPRAAVEARHAPGRSEPEAPLRLLLRGPLQRSRLTPMVDEERPRVRGADDREFRQTHDLPHRRGRIPRRATGPSWTRSTSSSGKTTRIFHSEAPYYEEPVGVRRCRGARSS